MQFLDDFFWFMSFDTHFRSSVLLIIKVDRLIGGGINVLLCIAHSCESPSHQCLPNCVG